jgi:hypothetical protein
MKGDKVKIWKEAVVTYFRVIYWHYHVEECIWRNGAYQYDNFGRLMQK